MTEEIDPAKSRALEASKEETFNFLDRLTDRDYATEDVEIWLDEGGAHRLAKLREQHGAERDGEKADAIQDQIDELLERLKNSRYIVHLSGISSETYDAVVDAAQKEFPVEYEVSRNPLTMAAEKEIIPSEAREQFFRTHLWAKFITGVTAPNGATDNNITPEWVAVFLNRAPIAAVGRVMQKIEELRMITNWMDELQGPDFLAKS